MRKTLTKNEDQSSKNSSDLFFSKKEESQSNFSEGVSNHFFTIPSVQTKLEIGAPNDRFEKEADQMADQVVQKKASTPTHNFLQTKCAACTEEEESIQMKPLTPIKQTTTPDNFIQKQDGPRGRRRRRGRGRRDRQSHVVAYTIRDAGIGLGGSVVADLSEFKQRVMARRVETSWTLILAIHGSEQRVAAQEPPNWQENAVFYRAEDIEQLFNGDAAWTAWRDQFGPTQMTLIGCQVSVDLERTIINNITRGVGGRRQTASGLGTGCVPLSRSRTFSGMRGEALRDELLALNDTYGYYGSPPVPDDEVMTYYRDEVPRNAWVIVEVGQKIGDSHDEPHNTGIPFWNRTRGSNGTAFRSICNQGVGGLRERQTRVPPSAD